MDHSYLRYLIYYRGRLSSLFFFFSLVFILTISLCLLTYRYNFIYQWIEIYLLYIWHVFFFQNFLTPFFIIITCISFLLGTCSDTGDNCWEKEIDQSSSGHVAGSCKTARRYRSSDKEVDWFIICSDHLLTIHTWGDQYFMLLRPDSHESNLILANTILDKNNKPTSDRRTTHHVRFACSSCCQTIIDSYFL